MLEIRPILNSMLRHKSSALLIIVQIAITLAVVVNSVFIISERLSKIDAKSGLPEEQLFVFNMSFIDDSINLEQAIKLDQDMIRSLPGVIDAAYLNAFPLGRGGDSSTVSTTPGEMSNENNMNIAFYRGDHHIINAFGVKLTSGRNFREDDVVYTSASNEPRVAIITQSLADHLFPNGDALGNKFYSGGSERTIIGIVDYLVSPWVNSANHTRAILTPVVQLSGFKRFMVRAEPESIAELMANIEAKLIELNPDRVVTSLSTMLENRRLSYQNDNAMTKILLVVISLLIAITALGIIGQVSFNISQRIKQIGTRRALGATKTDILRYFIVENILTTLIGVSFGTLLCIAFNIYLVKEFQLSPIDWYFVPLGVLMMLMTGLIATWNPARKASNVPAAVATQSI